jgi:Tol biopolymer transport system component
MKRIISLTLCVLIFVLTVNGVVKGTQNAQAAGYPELISISLDGTAGNSWSQYPSINSYGRYVVFASAASNLVADDTNGEVDIFVYDRQTSYTQRVNVTSDGSQAIDTWGAWGSSDPSISADGRFITFTSYASNLVPNDTNGEQGNTAWRGDIFVHDRQTGKTERVNISSEGIQALGGVSFSSSISGNGRFVAFVSEASNLVPNDVNGNSADIFVHDRQTGETKAVSITPDGETGNAYSQSPTISTDGRYIIFASMASNLVSGDTNEMEDVYLYDQQTNTVELISATFDGASADEPSFPNLYRNGRFITADGRYVVFVSTATNILQQAVQITSVYIRDRFTGTTELASVASDGTPANSTSSMPSITPDGRYLLFESKAWNLFLGDTSISRGWDIFIRDRWTGITKVIKEASDGKSFGTPLSRFAPYMSADGKYIAFGTPTGFVSYDSNNVYDIYVGQNPFLLAENQAPVLVPIGNKSVNEGELLQFTIFATDPDGNNLTYSAANLPLGASFNPGTATLSWTPSFTQEGNYPNVEFTVTDDGSPIELDTELITITVGDVNRTPFFDPIGPQEVLENEQLTFVVTATDPDGDGITLSASNLPAGASFDSQTGMFSWLPTLSQAGYYIVTFNSTDNGIPPKMGSTDVSITVGDNPTPIEQAEYLNTLVISYSFPTNIENSYLANLKKVAIFIQDGQTQAAINQLNSFIVKVKNDYSSHKISQEVRNQLIRLTEALLEDLQ